VEIAGKDRCGRPVRLILGDERGRSITMGAEDFRLAVDPSGRVVRSTFFAASDEGGAVLLADGRGFGHGMGLCQYGAESLSRQGWSAGRILAYYYPTSRLARAY